jgi:TRAP-type mannitol/chloroaromatic compound transport system permease large subunit
MVSLVRVYIAYILVWAKVRMEKVQEINVQMHIEMHICSHI